VLEITESVRSEGVALLESLIAIRSVNPPGDEDAVADYVEAHLGDAGIASTRVPLEAGRSSIVARIPGKEPGCLVLCGHLDTVNADAGQWSSDPFEARSDGERVWGLGAADMKSGVAALIQVARELVRQSEMPRYDIVLALTADEECAYRGAASVAASGLIDDARFLLITEPTAGRAYLGQKGELWIEATFEGRAAHGSIPHSGISAILPAAEFCLRLAEESAAFPEIEGHGTTSLNIGQIHGGCRVNIVPDKATVRLDSRVVTEDERNRVVAWVDEMGQKIAGTWGARFESKVFTDHAPIVNDSDSEDVLRFLDVLADVTGWPTRREIAPYSTDAVAIVPRLGVPVIIYGPGSIEQAHQPDEYVDLASFYEALEVIGRFASAPREESMDEPVAQTSSPCETEDITAEGAETAEQEERGMGTSMLHLRGLGGGIPGIGI